MLVSRPSTAVRTTREDASERSRQLLERAELHPVRRGRGRGDL